MQIRVQALWHTEGGTEMRILLNYFLHIWSGLYDDAAAAAVTNVIHSDT